MSRLPKRGREDCPWAERVRCFKRLKVKTKFKSAPPFIDHGHRMANRSGPTLCIVEVITSVEHLVPMINAYIGYQNRPNLRIRLGDIEDHFPYRWLELAAIAALQWTHSVTLDSMMKALFSLMEGDMMHSGRYCMTFDTVDSTLQELHGKLFRFLKRFRNLIGIGIFNLCHNTSLKLKKNGDLLAPPAFLLLVGEDPKNVFPALMSVPREAAKDVAEQANSIFGPLIQEMGIQMSKIVGIFKDLELSIVSMREITGDTTFVACNVFRTEMDGLVKKFNGISGEFNKATRRQEMKHRFCDLQLCEDLTWPPTPMRVSLHGLV